jgi:hypothetical protein
MSDLINAKKVSDLRNVVTDGTWQFLTIIRD